MRRILVAGLAAASMAIAVNHAAAQQRPRDFDILGIRMGMSPADVAAKLREADPGATVRTGKMAQLKTTGGTVFAEYVPRIRFNNAKSLHNGNGFFMPRTGDNTLVQFQRVVYHSDGAGVLPDAYIRSLMEKYGPPQHREGDDSAMAFRHRWRMQSANGSRSPRVVEIRPACGCLSGRHRGPQTMPRCSAVPLLFGQ